MLFKEKLSRLTETSNKSALARKAGLHVTSIYSYLQGEYLPSVPAALSLAAELRVDAGWLIDDRQEWPPVRVETAELEPAAA